jgi:hypothetical protein
MNIIVEVDAHIGTCVELASQLRLPVSALDTIVKNNDETEGNYVHCGPLPEQCKSLKCSPLEVLESALAS